MNSTEFEHARDKLHALRLGLKAYVKTDMYMSDIFFKGASGILDLIIEEYSKSLSCESECEAFDDLANELSDDILFHEKKSKKERLWLRQDYV